MTHLDTSQNFYATNFSNMRRLDNLFKKVYISKKKYTAVIKYKEKHFEILLECINFTYALVL